MASDGSLNVLHPFTGGSDGATPKAALMQAVDGKFYGTTQAGGSSNRGTTFSMTPGGAVTPERRSQTAFRLSFSMLEPEQLDEGVSRLARAMREVRRRARHSRAVPAS